MTAVGVASETGIVISAVAEVMEEAVIALEIGKAGTPRGIGAACAMVRREEAGKITAAVTGAAVEGLTGAGMTMVEVTGWTATVGGVWRRVIAAWMS